MLTILLVSLGTALVVGWVLVRFESVHARFSHDHTSSGPQKFHARATPRVGGVPVACGLAAGLATGVGMGHIELPFAVSIALSVLPAFASGLIEDLSKKIGPDMRLWASFLSALVGVYFFDAVVDRSDVPGIDSLLAWYPLALVFTVVGVGGVAHAVNIIDGYNGLAGGVTTMMLAALGFVSWQVGDSELTALCLALMGGTVGLLFWNFPHGRLFAGDGGAYLWGVCVGLVSVLLIHRHREVSPWFPMTVLIYPVFETLFSIYRRRVKQSAAAGLPDAKHLHQLIYRRLLSTRTPRRKFSQDAQILLNAATSPFLWALAAITILPSALIWRDSGALIALTLAFCLTYVWLYRAIVRMSVPNELRRLGRFAARFAVGADADKPS